MAKTNQAMQDLLSYNAAILPRKRSSFDKSHSHTTTFDSAWLVPIMWDRVLPGDEKKIRYSGLARMNTPYHPVMDNADLNVWCFFVPDRLWWCHAKEFYGENKDAEFNPDVSYVMPYLKPSQYLVDEDGDEQSNGLGSLNDYFGFPVENNSGFITVVDQNDAFRCTAGLHRSYQLIWNEYFRNSSIQDSLHLSDGDNVTSTEWNTIRAKRRVNKVPDMFTSLLLSPQSGSDVLLPLGDWAPVVTRSVAHSVGADKSYLLFEKKDGSGTGVSSSGALLGLTSSGVLSKSSTAAGTLGSDQYVPSNLYADLSLASSASINELRAAITAQQLMEISNMAGKRFQQIISAHWGVFTPDDVLQRPSLLGASVTPVGMRQVLQTSQTTTGADGSPQGNTAAVSVTNLSNEWICNKAFTEPGFIMVLAAVRPVHSYSQGLDPLLTKLTPYEHYWPVFDNLGNQPVKVSAVYFKQNGTLMPNEQLNGVFGYQEAWTEYRIKPNRVSGKMRPDVSGSLASWNYSTLLDGVPELDDFFIREDENLIDRTIVVEDEPQFMLDSYFEYIDIKNMGVHSIPGLTRL